MRASYTAAGCLFEDSLCTPSEACVNDGVFGRCQKLPVLDVHRDEVPPGALQHLRGTLQTLSRTGLTWQDDYTQHVTAQELTDVPSVRPQRPDASTPARTPKLNVENERRRHPENSVALAETLQRYLPSLGALSLTSSAGTHPRTRHGEALAKGDDSLSQDTLAGVALAAALTYPPGPWATYPEDLPLRPRSRLQPDELSPKVDGALDRRHPMAALGTYAAQRPLMAPREGDPGPRDLLHLPPRAPPPLWALAGPQKWPLPPGESRGAPSMGDGARVRDLLEELRRWPAEQAQSPPGQQDITDAVTQAELGVDPGEAGGDPPGMTGSLEAVPWGQRLRGGRGDGAGGAEGADVEVSRLGDQLGDLSGGRGPPFLPGAPRPSTSLEAEMKKSRDPEASSEHVGVENVRSRAYSKAPVKELGLQPGAEELGERQPWVRGALEQEPGLPPGESLRLEVAPEEERGYIVTNSDPLSPDKGTRLLKDLAHLLQVPASVFVDTDVLGPAVTFRVHANAQNVTAAEVAQAAADNKDKLGGTSGLKILQTGTGSRSRLKLLPHQAEQEDSAKFIVLTLVSLAGIVGVLLASCLVYCLRHSSQSKLQEKLPGLGPGPGPDATAAYQELCRQRMAPRPPDRPEGPHTSRISSVSSQLSDGPVASPSARSTSSWSWSEEPVQPNMDISTGHVILAYMEDHLKNKNRLEKEWEALCNYQAEPGSSLVAQREENVLKNRSLAVLTLPQIRWRLPASAQLPRPEQWPQPGSQASPCARPAQPSKRYEDSLGHLASGHLALAPGPGAAALRRTLGSAQTNGEAREDAGGCQAVCKPCAILPVSELGPLLPPPCILGMCAGYEGEQEGELVPRLRCPTRCDPEQPECPPQSGGRGLSASGKRPAALPAALSLAEGSFSLSGRATLATAAERDPETSPCHFSVEMPKVMVPTDPWRMSSVASLCFWRPGAGGPATFSRALLVHESCLPVTWQQKPAPSALWGRSLLAQDAFRLRLELTLVTGLDVLTSGQTLPSWSCGSVAASAPAWSSPPTSVRQGSSGIRQQPGLEGASSTGLPLGPLPHPVRSAPGPEHFEISLSDSPGPDPILPQGHHLTLSAATWFTVERSHQTPLLDSSHLLLEPEYLPSKVLVVAPGVQGLTWHPVTEALPGVHREPRCSSRWTSGQKARGRAPPTISAALHCPAPHLGPACRPVSAEQPATWHVCCVTGRGHEGVLQEMDHDPRNPAYIATQGPLPATVADFWQMVWESGCVVIVMLTPLTENGVRQCYHYWPGEGSNLYHIYEVHLVSEHTWCEDFLVRSFYLKNLQTNETRTVTQFHFLTWYDQGVPPSTRPLLDFRRKVNKCYRGRSCPVTVHCSDGAGRSGTYILIDMVLNKMAKGAKEIDIAATLEHLRDQRPGMVQTKEQFEFALTAVAEEVNAVLKALPQ
ncbi:receptor-type tyrosine-protein phosphatase N2 [Tupaia chinensis]|uniref:receptor-type tyrosine-protein phosphatase N2 n=1 Tax=Tupaia chinensis TaxID=246437 RepID=UPI0003C8D47D|nr:receptor-type tyrosine-protein phosphatase N2 [Tupaia chinensis]